MAKPTIPTTQCVAWEYLGCQYLYWHNTPLAPLLWLLLFCLSCHLYCLEGVTVRWGPCEWNAREG